MRRRHGALYDGLTRNQQVVSLGAFPAPFDTVEYLQCGSAVQGPVACAQSGALGLFAIFGEFSSDLCEAEWMNDQAAMTHEAVLELNCMYNPTPWLDVQPDVQG